MDTAIVIWSIVAIGACAVILVVIVAFDIYRSNRPLPPPYFAESSLPDPRDPPDDQRQ